MSSADPPTDRPPRRRPPHATAAIPIHPDVNKYLHERFPGARTQADAVVEDPLSPAPELLEAEAYLALTGPAVHARPEPGPLDFFRNNPAGLIIAVLSLALFMTGLFTILFRTLEWVAGL